MMKIKDEFKHILTSNKSEDNPYSLCFLPKKNWEGKTIYYAGIREKNGWDCGVPGVSATDTTDEMEARKSVRAMNLRHKRVKAISLSQGNKAVCL